MSSSKRPLQRRSRAVALAGFALVLLRSPAAIGAQQGAQQGALQEVVDVSLVNVDVVVLDKNGNLVTDLGREDFQITDDGKKVEVGYFAPLLTATGTAAATAARSEAPSGARAGGADARHLVVFVDLDSQAPHSRQRVLSELASRLATLDGRGVRVMVATFGSKGLNVELPFSESPAEWETAITAVQALPGRGTFRQMRQQRLVESIEQVLRQAEGSERNALRLARNQLDALIGSVQVESEAVRAESLNTIKAMQMMASVLSTVSGQKALLYVGDGVPIRPGQDLLDLVADAFQSDPRFEQSGRSAPPSRSSGSSGSTDGAPPGSPGGGLGATEELTPMTTSANTLRLEGMNFDLTQELRVLAGIANNQRVTLYGVSTDAPGVTMRADTNVGTHGAVGLFQTYDTARSQLMEQSLDLMAQETGGLALPANADVADFLDRMLRDQESRYSLAYTSPHGGDSRYHRIKVKVNRKGVRLRHREGYIDRAREVGISDLVVGALLLGSGENPHRMEMKVASQAPAENDEVAVSLALRIPIDQLHLVDAGDNQETKLDLYYLSKDASGALAPMRYVSFTVAIPSARMAEAKGQFYGATLPLSLKKGPQAIAVGIVEPGAQRTSVARTAVEVGAPATPSQ